VEFEMSRLMLSKNVGTIGATNSRCICISDGTGANKEANIVRNSGAHLSC